MSLLHFSSDEISELAWHQLLWNSICNFWQIAPFSVGDKPCTTPWRENVSKKTTEKFWNNGREFVIWLLKQPNCKIEQTSLWLLKKRIVAVLLFGLLPVLSERIVANFRGHVTCCFSLLEGLLYARSLKYCASITHFLSVYYFVMISSLLVIQQRLFEFIAY